MGRFEHYQILRQLKDKELYDLEIDGVVVQKTGRDLKNYISTQRGAINFSYQQPGENLTHTKQNKDGRNLQPVL